MIVDIVEILIWLHIPLNDLPSIWQDPDTVTDHDNDHNIDVDLGEGHLSLS